jgi:histidinol-phosphate phosphatase family protein
MKLDCAVVVPTIGRDSLQHLLLALDSQDGPQPAEIVVVDDRVEPHPPIVPVSRLSTRVLPSGGRGPAAARNVGWRATDTRWVSFLDDDVVPDPDWLARLADDLNRAEDARAAGCQGVLAVPSPAAGRPTDDERRTQRLVTARWITADMVYRRDVLLALGGFDERFPRAYREDSDLALRLVSSGHRIISGTRRCTHPIAESTLLSSVRAQIGNRDNALMRRKFGATWRRRIGEDHGRLPTHTATVVAGLGATLAAAVRRWRWAAIGASAWLALTLEFASRRFLSSSQSAGEALRLALTSALIPPAAVWHRATGEWQHRLAEPEPVLAVLLDRDDTIIEDGPFLNDPTHVRPLPGVVHALRRLRERGLLLGIVSNQSGVARGLISPQQLAAVNAEVDAVLGPFDCWQVCVHDDGDGCACRKPQPGLVLAAAASLGVPPHRCVMIGDTGGDVDAALSANAGAVLVPTPRTRFAEIAHARLRAQVAATLNEAVSLVLRESR